MKIKLVIEKYENKSLEFNPAMFEKITGIKIEKDEMTKILLDLGFVIAENKKNLQWFALSLNLYVFFHN